MKPITLVWAGLLLVVIDRAGGAELDSATLFARHFQAVGADARVLTNSWCAKVSGSLADDQGAREFTLLIKSPGLGLLTTTDSQGKTVKRGRSDDAQFWEQTSAGVQDLGPGAGELSGLMLALNPPGLAAIGERLEDCLCQPDAAEHRPVTAVGRKHDRGIFPRLLFDDQTSRLVRIGQTRLDEYRTVDGIALPHRIRQGATAVYTISSIQRLDEIPASTFDRPGPKGGWLSQVSAGNYTHSVPVNTLISRPGKLEVVRQPPAALASTFKLRKLSTYDSNSGRHAQIPLQGGDLSKLDLTGRGQDLLHADFDTKTRWPSALPPEFNPQAVMRAGLNPGLGLRALHAKGIDGRGVGLATVDFPLLTSHVEYADRLRLYEEVQCPSGMRAHMHGTAVASIAVGKTCGVAPGADLYHIGSQNASFVKGKMAIDFRPIASAIDRLLEVNALLPADRKIRVISLSMGWSPGEPGFAEVMTAVQRARTQGVFVISTVLRRTHELQFDGLNRPASADPEAPESYGPGSWWAGRFWGGEMRFRPGKRFCVPMDGRTTASPKGLTDYVHYDSSGWSWSVPWVAGLYALACQVDPGITPERFWDLALRTGHTVQLKHRDEDIPFGTIANPLELIRALESESQKDSRHATE